MPQIVKAYCDATFLPKRGKQSNRPNAACGIVIVAPDGEISRFQEKIYRVHSSGEAEAVGVMKTADRVYRIFGPDINLVIFNDSEEICFNIKKLQYPWHDKCKTSFSEAVRYNISSKINRFNHASILYKSDSNVFIKEAHNMSRGCVARRGKDEGFCSPKMRKRVRYIMRKFYRLGLFD
jgi:hypothetical protein